MTTRNMLMMAGAGALAYYYFKKKSSGAKSEGPGVLKRFVDKVTSSVGKNLDDIGDDITTRPGMQPSMNR